jgi:hypothetical protein
VFVVKGVVAEADVQDAHEAVARGAEGLVVAVLGCASLVVELAGAGLVDRAQKAHRSTAR